MNKGSRMTSGTTDIETGIGFRTNGRKEKAPQVNSPRWRIESAGNGHTRRMDYTRIETEAGGAARRICPNAIRDNRRRDGREGEYVLSRREDSEAVSRLHRELRTRAGNQIALQ